MRYKKLINIIPLLLFLLLTGCLTQDSLVTPYTNNTNLDVNKKILRRAITRAVHRAPQWHLVDRTKDAIIARCAWLYNQHSFTVKLNLKKDSYTFEYMNSRNLNYRESIWSDSKSIHGAYNDYIAVLNNKIIQNIPIIKGRVERLYEKHKDFDKLIGKTVAEIKTIKGPPHEIMSDSKGGKILIYKIGLLKSPNKSKLYVLSGSTTTYPGKTFQTYLYLYADSDGTVYKWMTKTKEE